MDVIYTQHLRLPKQYKNQGQYHWTVIMALLSLGMQFQFSWVRIIDEINAGNTQKRHYLTLLITQHTEPFY